jgi:hypothetical protein
MIENVAGFFSILLEWDAEERRSASAASPQDQEATEPFLRRDDPSHSDV